MYNILAYFADESKNNIIFIAGWLEGSTDTEFFGPTYGYVTEADPRYAAFYEGFPEFLRGDMPVPTAVGNEQDAHIA